MSKELEHVRRINQSVEYLISTVDKVQHDLTRTGDSSKNANQLLGMWIKILSQTQHTANLLNDPNWRGNAPTAELIRKFEKEKELRKAKEEEDRARAMELEKLRRTREPGVGASSGAGLAGVAATNRSTRVRRPMPTNSVAARTRGTGTRSVKSAK